MDIQNQPVASYFGAMSPAPSGSLNIRTSKSPIQFRVTFANNCGAPVTVAMRNGMKFVLQHDPSFDHKTILIRTSISIRADAYDSVLTSLSEAMSSRSKEIEALTENVKLMINGNSWNGGEVVLDYEITHERLEQMGGSAYYHDVDYVVSLLPIGSGVYHPHSEEGRGKQVVYDNALFGKSYKEVNEGAMGFGFSIVMIDNERKYGSRYINIGKQVYRVTPQVDVSKRDGIFIVSNHSMSSRGGNGSFESRFIDFEHAEETLGLYRTPDEAEHAGDVAFANKEKLLKAQTELENLKVDRQKADEANAVEKARMEAALRERELQIQKEREVLERERDERTHQESIRRQELKDHFEERSYVRKDTSEGLKFLPTLLVGLGALLGFIGLGSR